MFQDAALFPWLTVARNVELPLQFRKVGKADRRRRVAELLEMVHLGAFATKRPHELSGGMRQRVALARALAQHAPILLMDEPFGALDAITRDLLHDELERLWRDTGLTVVFVTHNVREAVRLGDRVVMLSSRPGPGRRRFHRRRAPAPAHRVARSGGHLLGDPRPAPQGGGPPWRSLKPAIRRSTPSWPASPGSTLCPTRRPGRRGCGRRPGPSWPPPSSASPPGSSWCGPIGSRRTSCPGRAPCSGPSGPSWCTATC